GCVGDERAHRVRDEERDLERVDRADDAEVAARDHLADEPEHPREPRREREDRRRTREPAAFRGLLHGGEYDCDTRRNSLWYHPRARRCGPFHAYAEHQATEEA